MPIITPAAPSVRASEILSRVRISDVYHALTGRPPKRAGAGKWRGPAEWRRGSGLNVSLDDSRGVWHDFVTGEGGGILDLAVLVRGGTRQEALRWVADLIGKPLDGRALPTVDRFSWARRQRLIEAHLPSATIWRRTAVALGEMVLDELKEMLWDRTLPDDEVADIARWTAMVARWRRLEGSDLVEAYTYWTERQPLWTAALVNAGRLHEKAARRAVCRYIGTAAPEAVS